MKKYSLSKLFFLLVLFQSSFIVSTIAQDVIYTKDAREISVKIESSDGNSVKFRPYDQQDSPIRTMDAQYIDYIKYEDGTIERFVADKTEHKESGQTTLDYLKIEYEKNLAEYNVHKKWAGASLITAYGTAAVGFTLILLSIESDEAFQTGGVLLGISGASLVSFFVNSSISSRSATKMLHFEERINNLSLIITPNNQPFLTNNKNLADNYSIGLRVRF